MGNRILGIGMATLTLVLSTVLLACGQGDGNSDSDLVAFDALIANPRQYAGQYVCTGGVYVEGFEASGLAASMYEKDGYPQLTEPVIWLEGADFQSREDCTRADTHPPFEFCQAVVCGVFESGGGYGHLGAYVHRLRGQDVPVPPVPTPPAAGLISIREGFESGLGDWQMGSDLPQDPNRPGQPVAWSIDTNTEQASEGQMSAKFTLDGTQDDGTIWLVRPFDVLPGEDLIVDLSFDLWSESESFNTLAKVAAYAGLRPPEAEEDFDLSQPANQVTGWQRYAYGIAMRSDQSRRGWVAVGISVVWETEVAYYLDNLQVEVRAWSAAFVPTAPLTDKTPLAREHEGESAEVEPPPARLEIAGQEQVSGIGTYCWQKTTGTDTSVGVCADMAGIPTAKEPLLAGLPFTATFRLAPEEPPDELLLEVIPVTGEDELERWPAGSRGWVFKEGERYSLPLEREPSLELSLQPGLYVLNLAGWWQAWGDASYGFLVQVDLPPPILLVDEHPIVAAEVDGPGHLEYIDRMGDDILARIEGLRGYAAEQKLARTNAALSPFGYRLEARFDAEWDRTFYDLYRDGEAEPIQAGLSHFWPVSVNASGTNFSFVAENAPNLSPLCLQVQAGSVEPWDTDQSAYLPPAYVGDALARVTFTGFPTLTYQVELEDGRTVADGLAVYSGTAVALGAYMPLRSFTTWNGHWALEVDDHLIMDGQDIGEILGYDAAFGFSLIRGRPFYFFEREGKVRMSYGGQTLPNVYDQVVHNQCCEAAIHNVETLGDVVLFHALWDGTWYFVEAGVYDGEMAGTYRYTTSEGWSFRYPMHWDRLDEESGFVQDTVTGKTVTFASQPTTQAKLENWLESEIARKLAATESDNTLAEPLTTAQEGALTIYRYAILSRMEASESLLRTTVFFDGQRRYEFYAAIPPVAEEEYGALVTSFRLAGK